MTKHSIAFISKINKLNNYYKTKLSIYTLLMNRASKIYLIASYSCILAAGVFDILMLIYSNSMLFAILALVTVSVGVFLLIKSVRQSRYFILNEHRDYAVLLKNRYLTFNREVINLIRADKLYEEITRNSLIEKAEIDEYIDYFSSKADEQRSKRWIPISLIVLILFPLWGEYVGFSYGLADRFSESWIPLIIVVPLAILLIIITLMARFVLEELILYEAARLNILSDVLKMVKRFP